MRQYLGRLLLINRDYTLLWIGQLVSQLGNRIYLMALAWYFVSVLEDGSGLFMLFMVSALAPLLFGVGVGPMVERWNKQHIVILCDLLSAMLVGVLALSVMIGTAPVWLVYAVCFLLNTVNLFFSPSVNVMFPSLVGKENVPKAVSYIRMVTYMGQVMGAAVGGVLVGAIGVNAALWVNALSFLVSAVMNMFIRYCESHTPLTGKYKDQLLDGLRYINKNIVVRTMLLIAALCNLFLPVLIVYIPILIKTEMGLDSIHYGIADAAMPVGAVLVSFLLGRYQPRTSALTQMALGIGAVSVIYLLIGLMPRFAVVVCGMLAYGVALNFVNVCILSFFIQSVEIDFRGRVMSLLETISFASVSLSYLLANILCSTLGTRPALLIGGGALVWMSVCIVLLIVKMRIKKQKIQS